MAAKGENPLSSGFYARFYRDAPEVLLDEPCFAILWKPHFMHSAPLREGEGGNLLFWYLSQAETPDEARNVAGKKIAERGLLHRLDFATAGLVLVAKTQSSFDFLDKAQKEGLFVKSYRAFCDCAGGDGESAPYKGKMSFCVKSRFRAFGQGGKEVRPVFLGEAEGGALSSAKRKKRVSAREYSTNVSIEEIAPDGKTASVLCSLSLGFRHQVRAHLASMGLPVCGDELYNQLCKRPHSGEGKEGGQAFMQLIATSLSFPHPSGEGLVSFSLPPASKTSPQSKGQPLPFPLPQSRT